ncbi:MAG TPA: D-alanyl-D-alanine carboxypeptidase family protein [Hyphomicrobiaceae bacterium]
MRASKMLSVVIASTVALSPAAAGPALLFDPANGRVLYAEDQDDQWYPASLTKIMTAFLVFEALRDGKIGLQDKIKVSELAHSQPPSHLGLPVGAEITVETALQALVVKSANDAAVMLAEALSGTQEAFAERMNATAKRLGMTRTNYVNANGLPAPEQVSTARDLARLTTAVVRDFPNYAHLWSMEEFRVGKRVLRNHNPLLRTYEGADGMKTGFICDSGYNLVASASRDGQKLVAVVLGETTGRNRSARAANLLEHGFQTLGWKALFGSENLDTLPLAVDAKGAVSIRQSVISWACGTGRRRAVARARHKAKRGAVAAAVKKAAAAKKAPAAADD